MKKNYKELPKSLQNLNSFTNLFYLSSFPCLTRHIMHLFETILLDKKKNCFLRKLFYPLSSLNFGVAHSILNKSLVHSGTRLIRLEGKNCCYPHFPNATKYCKQIPSAKAIKTKRNLFLNEILNINIKIFHIKELNLFLTGQMFVQK